MTREKFRETRFYYKMPVTNHLGERIGIIDVDWCNEKIYCDDGITYYMEDIEVMILARRRKRIYIKINLPIKFSDPQIKRDRVAFETLTRLRNAGFDADIVDDDGRYRREV